MGCEVRQNRPETEKEKKETEDKKATVRSPPIYVSRGRGRGTATVIVLNAAMVQSIELNSTGSTSPAMQRI